MSCEHKVSIFLMIAKYASFPSFLFLFVFIFISYFWLWLEVQKCQLNLSPDVIKNWHIWSYPLQLLSKCIIFLSASPTPFYRASSICLLLSWKYVLFKGARFLLRLFAPKIRYVMKNASWQGIRREKEIYARKEQKVKKKKKDKIAMNKQ